jgi:hypothetical protein
VPAVGACVRPVHAARASRERLPVDVVGFLCAYAMVPPSSSPLSSKLMSLEIV